MLDPVSQFRVGQASSRRFSSMASKLQFTDGTKSRRLLLHRCRCQPLQQSRRRRRICPIVAVVKRAAQFNFFTSSSPVVISTDVLWKPLNYEICSAQLKGRNPTDFTGHVTSLRPSSVGRSGIFLNRKVGTLSSTWLAKRRKTHRDRQLLGVPSVSFSITKLKIFVHQIKKYGKTCNNS